MDAWQQMLACNCERTVITYSALIAACEKDGAWQAALRVYSHMLQDG